MRQQAEVTLTKAAAGPAVSVVGLGKLGSCTAAALASRGLAVIGVDVNQRSIDLINQGRAPVDEAGLEQLIQDNRARLHATASYEDAVLRSDITLILVPTPSNPAGGFSLEYVRQATVKIGQALARKPTYHLVVLVSTVLPGASESEVIPLLEHYSGKRCGPGFGFCYGPEFIALGNVVRDFLNPDFVLIGEYDSRSGDLLSEMYERACLNAPPIVRLSVINAELTKLAVNTYVTTKISFANMLTEICAQLPGADVDAVADAMGHDRRIGRAYLTGGVSYGGPCFPRDNMALAYLARTVGANADLAEATHNYNVAHNQWLLDRVNACAEQDATVAVVGLTYRPGTPVIEQAPGMWLTEQLVAAGKRVVVYDGIALDLASKVLEGSVSYASSLADAVRAAEVVVLMTAGEEARSLRADDFKTGDGRPRTVIDCWRLCADSLASVPHINYVPMGVGQTAAVVPFATAEAAS